MTLDEQLKDYNQEKYNEENDKIRLYVCKKCGNIMHIGHEWRKHESAILSFALPDAHDVLKHALRRVELDTCKDCQDFSEMLHSQKIEDMFT
jgi:protein-arginine kinase activator protein McsA